MSIFLQLIPETGGQLERGEKSEKKCREGRCGICAKDVSAWTTCDCVLQLHSKSLLLLLLILLIFYLPFSFRSFPLTLSACVSKCQNYLASAFCLLRTIRQACFIACLFSLAVVLSLACPPVQLPIVHLCLLVSLGILSKQSSHLTQR